MVPDLKFLTESFNRFNREIFGGKLPSVDLAVSKARTYMGNLQWRVRTNPDGTPGKYAYKLRLSSAYDRTENELEDTVIHEMIHLYISYFNIADTAPHGVIFRGMMNEINTRFNRHIRVSHRGVAARMAEGQPRKYHVVAVVIFRDGRKGFKVLPKVETTIRRYCSRCLSVDEVSSVSLYLTDSCFFSRYPNSGSLKYHTVGHNILEDALKGAELIQI